MHYPAGCVPLANDFDLTYVTDHYSPCPGSLPRKYVILFSMHRLKDIDKVNLTAQCAVCGSVSVFIRHRRSRGATEWICAEKERERKRLADTKRRKNGPPRKPAKTNMTLCSRRRGVILESTYEEEFSRLLVLQSGLCDICEIQLREPHLDHCHKTGAIRGLLCPKCNKGIGLFNDDTCIIRNALTYLEK